MADVVPVPPANRPYISWKAWAAILPVILATVVGAYGFGFNHGAKELELYKKANELKLAETLSSMAKISTALERNVAAQSSIMELQKANEALSAENAFLKQQAQKVVILEKEIDDLRKQIMLAGAPEGQFVLRMGTAHEVVTGIIFSLETTSRAGASVMINGLGAADWWKVGATKDFKIGAKTCAVALMELNTYIDEATFRFRCVDSN